LKYTVVILAKQKLAKQTAEGFVLVTPEFLNRTAVYWRDKAAISSLIWYRTYLTVVCWDHSDWYYWSGISNGETWRNISRDPVYACHIATPLPLSGKLML